MKCYSKTARHIRVPKIPGKPGLTMPWLLKMLRSRPQNGEGLCRKTLSSGLQSPPHRPLHWRLKRPRRPDHPTEPAHTCKTWLVLLRTSSCSFWTCWERARALMRFTAPAVEKMKKMFTTESHEIAMAAASISALSPKNDHLRRRNRQAATLRVIEHHTCHPAASQLVSFLPCSTATRSHGGSTGAKVT